MIDPNNPFESLEAYRTVKRNSLNTDVETSELMREQYTELYELADRLHMDRAVGVEVPPYWERTDSDEERAMRQQDLLTDVLELLHKATILFDCSVKRSRSDFNNPSENLLQHNAEIVKGKGVCNG